MCSRASDKKMETISHDGDNGGGWMQYRRKNVNMEKIITSFYVSNLSNDTTLDMLEEAFRGFGRLADIYIPGRKDKAGLYFAFVKYRGVKNPEELAKSLNGVKCGRCVTQVNVSKYDKKGIRYNPAPQRRTTHQKEKIHHKTRSNTWDGRSFADVVTGKDSTILNIPKPPETPKVKLSRVAVMDSCEHLVLVGEAISLQHLIDLPKLIHADGEVPCELFYAGGLKVVLKFVSRHGAENYFKADYEWKKWFKWIKCGINAELNEERLAWVTLYGIPLHLRSDDNVIAIANQLGKVVEVDGQNWRCTDLSVSFARILTRDRKLINTVVNCEFNGKLYKVGVVERNEILDPISSYFEKVFNQTDNDNHLKEDTVSDNGDNDDGGADLSETDDDGVSETMLNIVEEGEIVEQVGDRNSSPPIDGPARCNSMISPEVEKSHWNSEALNSSFPVGMTATVPIPFRETVDESLTNISAGPACRPNSVPINTNLQPILVSPPLTAPCAYGDNHDPVKAPPFNTEDPLSKKRKRRSLSPDISRHSHIPLRLDKEFDLNVSVLNPCSDSAIDDCSSSSNEIRFISSIGKNMGFQMGAENSDRLVKILNNEAQGEGANVNSR